MRAAHSGHSGRKPKVTKSHLPVVWSAGNITPNWCWMGPCTPFQTKETLRRGHQSKPGSKQYCIHQHNKLKTKYSCWKQNLDVQPSLLPPKLKGLAAGTADAPTHWPICSSGASKSSEPDYDFQAELQRPSEASLIKTLLFYTDTVTNVLEGIFWANWEGRKEVGGKNFDRFRFL